MTSETPHALISWCPSSTAQIKMCGGRLSKQAAFSSGQMLCCMHVRLVSKQDSLYKYAN